MRRIMFSALLISVFNHTCSASLEQNITICTEEKSQTMMQSVAREIVDVVKKNPKAMIVLPFGDSSSRVYGALVEEYKNDVGLDFSTATWLVPGEYLAYAGGGHPLSVQYFINTYFVTPLILFDVARAPKLVLLPETSPSTIDLSVVEVGPAYPLANEQGVVELVGGHVIFNEAGTPMDSRFRTLTLSAQSKGSLNHKLKSMKALQANGFFSECENLPPEHVVSLGLVDIYNSGRVIMLAQGEDKAPILQQVKKSLSNPMFPATYFSDHPNIHWYVDENAAAGLGYYPWQVSYEGVEEKNYFNMNLCSCCLETTVGKQVSDRLPAEKLFQKALKERVGNETLPYNKRILVISPHPDDDVISMGGALQKILARKNVLNILYAVGGSNAVRDNNPVFIKYLSRSVSPTCAKELVREQEAINATKLLSIEKEQLTFFLAEYYDRRGIPGISPLSENDLTRMVETIKRLQPEYIYFAAENDPHGAHGLSTQLVAEAVKIIGDKAIKFIGYRGAYNEWPLYDPAPLSIIPFSQDELDLKIRAIKAHDSQLNPIYPSADKREFFERARDRNILTATRLNNLLDTNDYVAAEAYKEFSYEQFIELYGAK